MSRRKAAPVRLVLPDPLFKSELLAKFVNVMMRDGKKSVAETIMYDALAQVIKMMHSRLKSQPAKDEGEAAESGPAAILSRLQSGDLDIRVNHNARLAALEVFKDALAKVTPSVEVRSRRVGGSTYQVPVEIRAKRQMALAMRWLVQSAVKRHEKTMVLRLAGEIMDAVADRGNAVKKREDVHRMAKANQAFAHYRW